MATDTLKCSYCGTELVVGSAACPGCGTPASILFQESEPQARSKGWVPLVRSARFLNSALCLLVAAASLALLLSKDRPVQPKHYTKEELNTALTERLAPDEIAWFENPLDATPEMAD